MTSRLRSKLSQLGRLATQGSPKAVLGELRRWTWSEDLAVGLERDLTTDHEPPPARVPIEVKLLDDSIAAALFSPVGLDEASLVDMESRRRFWEDGIPGAHVALDDEDTPCYVQWAIPGTQSDLVKSYFAGGFPDLGDDEILLEAAWARPEARGKRIMAEAMSRITEEAAGPNHRRAITFVGVDNEPSIRGCRAAGFEPYVHRVERWRLGRRRVLWAELPVPGV